MRGFALCNGATQFGCSQRLSVGHRKVVKLCSTGHAVGEAKLLYTGPCAECRLRQRRRQELMGFSALKTAGCWKAL